MDTRTVPSNSLIGQSKLALDTPALLVDLDIMAANIARIVAACRTSGVAWRPHTKAHKTPEIAKMQTIGCCEARRDVLQCHRGDEIRLPGSSGTEQERVHEGVKNVLGQRSRRRRIGALADDATGLGHERWRWQTT